MNSEYLFAVGALFGFIAGYIYGGIDRRKIAGSSGDSNAVVAPAIAPGAGHPGVSLIPPARQ